MRFRPSIFLSATAIAITCVVSAAAYFYKTRTVEINEVMVFCKLQFNVFKQMDKLMIHVESAKKNIDVCMPSIHNPAIHARLVKAVSEKKIKLRILIDRDGYRDSTEFFITELINAGAEVKCRTHEIYNMQHKFCIVDDQILLTGTLNWGDDRSSDNWNYVYITSKSELVDPVKNEFGQMWSKGVPLEDALKLISIMDESDPCKPTEDPCKPTEINTSSDTVLSPGHESQIDNHNITIEMQTIPTETLKTPEICIH